MPRGSRERRSDQAAEDRDRTIRALRLVFMVVLPGISRAERDPSYTGLGFGRPPLSKLCVRSADFFQQLGAEMGEWWMRLAETSADADVGTFRRVERQHLEDAAIDLAREVSRMPRPVRDVIVRRASGMSWRRISTELPDRAVFSMTDDWETAVRSVWERHGDIVRRII